jgi:AraC-like DNA-binding protein
MPSTMGLVSRLAWQRVRKLGAAVGPLLKKSRLTSELLEDVESRLVVRDQIDFLHLAAEALGDDMLGFHLAQDFDLRRAGMYYYVLASSENLLELFARGARYSTLVNEGLSQRYVDDKRVGLAVRYLGSRRPMDRHQMEFWLTSLVRICRAGTGRQVKPARVRLTHYPGRGHAALSKFLGCRVEFGAATDSILFPRDLRDLPIARPDPFLNRLLVRMCEEALANRPRVAEPFVARVERVMAPLLPHGNARASEVATSLGMSQRTFARRLSEVDLTFSRLLHRLRLELAHRYLVEEKLAVSKVAWLLGYQEVGAFSHAFRRWTGKSPSEFARRGD